MPAEKTNQADDSYELHNLVVTIEGDPKKFVCAHRPGVAFRVEGENLIFEVNRFSMYALAMLIPFFPAKQRPTSPNDWMTTDERFPCPDPHCKAVFVVRREGTRVEHHSTATKVPLPGSS